jgi:hypothetical protein
VMNKSLCELWKKLLHPNPSEQRVLNLRIVRMKLMVC